VCGKKVPNFIRIFLHHLLLYPLLLLLPLLLLDLNIQVLGTYMSGICIELSLKVCTVSIK
jgi:hypothetical protein